MYHFFSLEIHNYLTTFLTRKLLLYHLPDSLFLFCIGSGAGIEFFLMKIHLFLSFVPVSINWTYSKAWGEGNCVFLILYWLPRLMDILKSQQVIVNHPEKKRFGTG
ncbi:hypothetical protein VNO77_42207 [Canavalia gladiata]|uniref:Uncharacterized protein n=1 Tax=Canavalia gladiata TaxID=3824 RepID=A0AAN9K169_CANGL